MDGSGGSVKLEADVLLLGGSTIYLYLKDGQWLDEGFPRPGWFALTEADMMTIKSFSEWYLDG